MDEIKLLNIVALLPDVPEEELRRGEVGTFAEVFEQAGDHLAGH